MRFWRPGPGVYALRGLGEAALLCVAAIGCSGSDGPSGAPGGAASTSAGGASGSAGGATTTSAAGSGGAATTAATTSGVGGASGSGGSGGAAGSGVDDGGPPSDAAPADAMRPADAADAPSTPGPDIDLSPSELVFSAFLGMKSEERLLTVRNVGTDALQIDSLTFRTAIFSAVSPPPTPLRIAPGAEATLHVIFSPAAGGTPGVEQGALHIASNDPDEAMIDVGLWGLSTRAAQGANEPPLAQIVEALGYAIDVGGKNLVLGTGANPIGDEVRAQHFRRAAPGAVTLRPVARYSPDEPVPYGYTTGTGAAPTLNQVGIMRMGQEQTLLPGVDPTSKPDFDPGDVPFGLYGKANNRTTYTDDALNTTGPAHAVRSYPLKDRAGHPVVNSYLVCFEEAANGDYNDYVFVLGNAMPAP